MKPRRLVSAVAVMALVIGGLWAGLMTPAHGAPNTFTNTGSMNYQRLWHTATLLFNGKVFVMGGVVRYNTFVLGTAEVYDPATGIWSNVTGLSGPPSALGSVGRYLHTATLMPDGRVVIAGGATGVPPFPQQSPGDQGNYTGGTAIYDPVNDFWRGLPLMEFPRIGHAASLLPNGDLLVVGGKADTFNNGGPQSAEHYFPGYSADWHVLDYILADTYYTAPPHNL